MKSSHSQRIRWIAALVIVSCLGGLIYALWIPKPISIEIVTVDSGTVEITVEDDGETRVRERYTITAPMAGKLVRLDVHPGDKVEKNGKQIATLEPLDPSLLDARARMENEGRVKAAEAAIARADQATSAAVEAVELAEHDWQRSKELLGSGAISRAEYDQSDHRYRIVQAELRAANFLRAIAEHELAIANAALFSSEGKGSDPIQIHSPIDGVVLRVYREDAGVVASGIPLLEIGNPRELEIQIDVLSTAAVSVRPGNHVTIESWGSERPLMGRVRRVEPSAFLKISALGVEEKRVLVLIDIDTPWEERKELGDGFRVEAKIIVETSDPTITRVPTAALERDGSDYFVYKIQPSGIGAPRVRRLPIKVGKSNRSVCEVISGILAGDEVVVYPPEKLRDGSSVRISRSSYATIP